MRPVGLFYNPVFLLHDLPGHPEHAGRLRAITAALDASKDRLSFVQYPNFLAATKAQLATVHTREYIDQVERSCAYGCGHMEGDTYLTDASFDAAAMAAGAGLRAVDGVRAGDFSSAFVLARPPGHHAFAGHGEGFCIFNTVALAAQHALNSGSGLQRVMILDWDVHHGNGTQDIFYSDPRVLYVSTHEWGIYPGTGHFDEVGDGAGRGFTLNVPLPSRADDTVARRVFDEIIAPKARAFRPELLLISAGFDAHWRDPLARLSWTLDGLAHLAASAIALAQALCGGRIVIVLEGGYDLEALSQGTLNTLWLLGGGDPCGVQDSLGPSPKHAAVDCEPVLQRIKAIHNL